MSKESPRTFKFKGFLATFLGLIAFMLFWISFVILELMKGEFGGVLFGLSAAAFLFLVDYIFLFGKAAIVIGDSAMTRVFLGRELQSLAWTDVERIVVFPMRSPGMSRSMTF
ncbi:hypothetical protein WCN79_21370 [Xanthomonas axonopodis pv. vasculorum]|uniref:Uncharacterized protein n=1 Tax=Xanthomonas axonopodis pv. vasculorum TaxID=325777 RepID=A0A098Q279_9XANT|nr:hypothetical protein [Xanthomonas axonopodis]KGE52963.1 hypothetical protein GW15_0205620 [Xanthomonas axonopodis pv. vasculorum]PPV04659.1 hypothetical protein XavaCFBP5823_21540 [Xanthomonas axonopodis pv. vasculorum]QKD85442.1 hypothetical protein XAV_01960 [Xanthomonas axonopodis pv. vasculorum]